MPATGTRGWTRSGRATRAGEAGQARARGLPRVRDLPERLHKRARKARVDLPTDLVSRLVAYLELLNLWNRKINLTSFSSWDQAIDRLLIEPLVAARYLPQDVSALLDIGSGGGSPAIPLKLAVPTLDLLMVEAKTRKSAFLREAIRHLGLEDVRVETARFEELLSYPELHEAMDVVTLRALRVESRVLMSLQAFLKPDGRILWFRGPSGQPAPSGLTPPLAWQGTYPLVDALQSRLVVVRKASVAGG